MNIYIGLLFIMILIIMLCKNNENYYNVFGQYIDAPFKETKHDNMNTLEFSYPYYASDYYPYRYYQMYYDFIRPVVPYG